MKDSEYFRAIQNKYRIKCTEPRICRSYRNSNCRESTTSSYSIVRDAPLKKKNHRTYSTKTKRRIVEHLYEEVGDETDFETTLTIILKPKLKGIHQIHETLFDGPDVSKSVEHLRDHTANDVLEDIAESLENVFMPLKGSSSNIILIYINCVNEIEFVLKIKEVPYCITS